MKKKFKKGVITTTKEVNKKVPKPKYSTKEEYLLHKEGHKPMLSSPNYAFFSHVDLCWIYYFPQGTGGYYEFKEEDFTKALIN